MVTCRRLQVDHLAAPKEPLTPGARFEDCTVARQDPKLGLLLKLGDEGEHYGYAHISRVADEHIDQLGKKYKVGSVHEGRTMQYNAIDGISTISLQKSILEVDLLRYEDATPGQLVDATISEVADFGLLVALSEFIKAMCPLSHLADVKLSNPNKKFKRGDVIPVRVLANNNRGSGRKQMLVTARKSLVKSRLPIVASYDEALVGTISHGVITALKDFGALVTFYNNVRGLVPASKFDRTMYTMGQTVKCKVLQCTPKEEKMLLTFNVDEEVAGPRRPTASGEAVADIETGSLISVKVTQVKPNKVMVELVDSDLECDIKSIHLSDHPAHWPTIASKYSVGDVIDEVLVVSKEGQAKRLLLSIKPSLKAAAAKGHASNKSITKLKIGSLHVGYIRSVTSYGCFVGLVHGLTGLVKMKDLADRFVADLAGDFAVGQTVAVQVLEYNAELDRAYFSLKGCDKRLNTMDKVFSKAYFRDQQLLKAGDGADSEAFAALSVGKKVKVTVTNVQKVGALVTLPGDIQGFVTLHHTKGVRCKAGAVLPARVLDLDKDKGIVDLTLRPDLLKAKPKKGDAAAAAAAEKLEVGSESTATIELVKEEHMVLALSDGGFGHALSKTPNDRQAPFSRYVCGMEINVVLAARASKRAVCLLRPNAEQVEKLGGAAKKGKGKGKGKADDGESGDKPKSTSNKPHVGSTVDITIKSIQDFQMNVNCGTFTGRVHITQVIDAAAADADAAAASPFAGYTPGQVVAATVVGVLERKKSAVSNPELTHKTYDFSLRPSVLAATSVPAMPTKNDFEQGQACIGWIHEVRESKIYVLLAPNVRGQVYQADTSSALKVSNALLKNFNPGQQVRCWVKKVTPGGLNLSLIEPNDDAAVGTVVTGKVTKVLEEAGLMVKVMQGVTGRAFLTNLSDSYKKEPTKNFTVGQTVRCLVVATNDKGNGKQEMELSLRPSHVTGVGEVKDAVVGDFGDVEADRVYRGYVVNSTDNGCFVAIGDNVIGRVQISNLSDQFIKDFKGAFPAGKRVTGRVVTVDPKRKRIELSLKQSVVDPDNFLAPKTFGSLSVGDKLSGSVKRVQTYGVFVALDNSKLSGLVHISEVSEDFIKDLNGLYTEGDRVKVLVTKLDAEKEKISLSMKASNFDAEDGSDDEDGGAAAAAEDGAAEENGEMSEDESGSDSDSDSDSDDERSAAQASMQLSDGPSAAADDSDGDDSASDSEEEEEEPPSRKRKFSELPDLFSGGVGFNSADTLEDELAGYSDSDAEEEDSDSASAKKKSKRAKRTAKAAEEERIRLQEEALLSDTKTPESADAFDRALMASPNSSYMWVQYMAFHLQLTEMDLARKVGERALKAISVREEGERMNVWIAKLNLENAYGDADTLKKCFDTAQQTNDSMSVHFHMASIYERSDKIDEADALFKVMCKKFRDEVKVWVSYGTFKMKNGKSEQARLVLQNSLKALPKREHIMVIIKFALLDFKLGSVERGRTIIENVLSNYPKRIDLWNVYIDQELRVADTVTVRALFDRVTALNLSSKKMKHFFKRYLDYEKTEGDEEKVEYVKERARDYIQSKMG